MATKRKQSRRQFGSIRQLSSGRYQIRYRGPDDKFYTGSMTYPTVADADATLATIQSDIIRRTWRAPVRSADTVTRFVSRWIAQNMDLKVTTRHLYEDLLRLHIASYPLGDLYLSDVTPDLVVTWHADLTRNLAERLATRTQRSTATSRTGSTTVAQAYRLLHAALQTATDHELLQRNPCQIPGGGKPKRQTASASATASRDEVAALANAMPDRYRVLVLMAAWTGLREGELFALRRSSFDLNPSDPTVRVRDRGYWTRGALDLDSPKSGAGERVVELPQFLVPLLREHLDAYVAEDGDAWVFSTRSGKPVTTSSLTPIWHRARAKAGRPDLRFHDLRHTGQTFAALVGAPEAELMQRMGHSSRDASSVYMHSDRSVARTVADRLSELATDTTVVPLRPRVRRSG